MITKKYPKCSVCKKPLKMNRKDIPHIFGKRVCKDCFDRLQDESRRERQGIVLKPKKITFMDKYLEKNKNPKIEPLPIKNKGIRL